jgi:hypothetical protein
VPVNVRGAKAATWALAAVDAGDTLIGGHVLEHLGGDVPQRRQVGHVLAGGIRGG